MSNPARRGRQVASPPNLDFSLPTPVSSPASDFLAIDVNDGGQVLAATGDTSGNVYCAFGSWGKDRVQWIQPFTLVVNTLLCPKVAINSAGQALLYGIEMNQFLAYFVGSVGSDGVTWSQFLNHVNNEKGSQPNIALNAGGDVVEVHKHQGSDVDKLFYTVGTLNGNEIQWLRNKATHYHDGTQPGIGLNDNGGVVETHTKDGQVRYDLGQLAGDGISNIGDSHELDDGTSQAIDIDDKNLVGAALLGGSSGDSWETFGGSADIGKDSIDWSDPAEAGYPITGIDLGIAKKSNMAVAILNQSSGRDPLGVGTMVGVFD